MSRHPSNTSQENPQGVAGKPVIHKVSCRPGKSGVSKHQVSVACLCFVFCPARQSAQDKSLLSSPGLCSQCKMKSMCFLLVKGCSDSPKAYAKAQHQCTNLRNKESEDHVKSIGLS